MDADAHDAVVRQSFEKQAALFVGDHSPFARRPASPLAWLEPVDPDMIVLDVACGAAHAAEQASPHVRQVVGIDLTPALLDLGAERLRGLGITNVLLQEGNAAALPFLDASFDLVMCRGALHHFADPTAAITEMGRVCRRGGRVVVADMVAPNADVRDAFDALHRCLDPSHAGVLLETELAELLEAEVGPLTYGETSDPFRIPVEHILSDAADRDAVRAALQAELTGGAATGFDPAVDDGQTLVSFTNTVIHATRVVG
ncbi:MAG TPA: methyltransferase domain-containing protein [Acidimicrobiia bacterium]|nr:methyltransferase domain-containing protein [Acidimicrobiia bacterium]